MAAAQHNCSVRFSRQKGLRGSRCVRGLPHDDGQLCAAGAALVFIQPQAWLDAAKVPGSKHKNGKPHSVPLNEMALAVLRKLRGNHATRVFTFRVDTIVQVNRRALPLALKGAGIADFRWHDLRHTFATWHRQAGTPKHELQRLGGWKTGAMAERYAHVAPEVLQGPVRHNGLMRSAAAKKLRHKGKRPRLDV